MSQDDPKFDTKINVDNSDLYILLVILPYILKSIWYNINKTLMDYESIWPEVGQILYRLYSCVSVGDHNLDTFYVRMSWGKARGQNV